MSRRKEPAIPNDLLDQLLAGADAGTALAQGGLLDALKKALTERALNAEMDYHLAGDDGTGNSRNGYGRKTITTDTGKLAIDVPRDRQSSFDPQLIANLTEEDDCVGHWIKATVQPDGRSWTMTNGRTGYSRNYLSK